MSSIVVQLADALVSALQGATWSGIAYTVRRTYIDCEDEQLTDDRTDVDVAVLVPDGFDAVELLIRGGMSRTVTIDVVVRKRFSAEEADSQTGAIQEQTIDELIDLVDVLVETGVDAGLAGMADASLVPPAAQDVIYRRDHLRTLRQFTSVFSLTFEIMTELT